MDIQDYIREINLTNERLEKSELYHGYLMKQADAEIKLKIILASKYLKTFRAFKKNLGVEMAFLMMLEQDDPETKEIEILFSQYASSKAQSEGLKVIIEAMDAKISYHQSLMKYQREGEGGRR